MAYDHYLAIHSTIISTKVHIKLAISCCICGLIVPIVEIILVSKLLFCGPNKVLHIFCNFPPLLSLACTNTSINVLVDFTIDAFKILATFSLILTSYLLMIKAIPYMGRMEGSILHMCGTPLGGADFLWKHSVHVCPSDEKLLLELRQGSGRLVCCHDPFP
ncbi:hypothetical protein JRQ81_009137 [Phrynocephalus forsythii]|uniref:Uncharacterized protein n=1 Tax=Phrynocephalus forsythii TaxID=171643 RepID=A0A9Q0XB76_9SAUR|nr:hypothetical protein JRQ81_009137 [Phrynocephalus forsythii]